jgi:hypothetical protein
MRRMPSSVQRNQTRRTRPAIEGLEDRRLLSNTSISTAATASGGVFSHRGSQFAYNTPSGGHAVIHVVGIGNLAGTTVSGGALNLVYGGTNAYSKIVSHVTGGNGLAPLASILNSQLIAAGAENSVSGVGGNVIASVYLSHFDLIAGGNINLTSGVNTVVLDSVGPDTQIHLRELPPAPSPTTTSTTSTLGVVTTQGGTTTGAAVRGTTTTGGTTSSTLQARQSATITNEGVSATYSSAKNLSQTLTSISGSFTPGANIVEPLPTGTPGQSPRPAPPGVILKINQVKGNSATNLLTDPKIFGYDPTTGELIRFSVNLTNSTGAVDSSFTPISVPGDPASAGLNLGWNGSQLDVLVSSGATVYAYNATTGAAVGSFTTSEPINSIAQADTVTVLGSYATNQLQMINLPLSLQTGVEQAAPGNPSAFTPSAGFTLLGGLTGFPGSTSVTAAAAAFFNTFQPTTYQLGLQPINTVNVSTHKHASALTYRFTGGTASALIQNGAFTPATPNLPSSTTPGAALGSIDQSTALVTGVSNGANTIQLSSGTLTLDYPNLLVGLSEAFRPDLTNSALVDVQGDVQSVRGGSANGLVLNDNGNLNLVKFASVTNSTIVGQPVGHLNITSRSNVTVLTPSRTINGSAGSFTNDGRNGVTVDTTLDPLGPLSQSNDG